MTRPLQAWVDGLARVSRAGLLVAGLWVTTLALGVPLMLSVQQSVTRHLGSSLEADTAASGVNYDWMQEFDDQATGLARSLTPGVIGFAVVLDNLSAFLDQSARPVLVMAAGVFYLVVLTFLSSGIIDRLARNRPVRAHDFFGLCGGFFFRFVRLGIFAAFCYALVLGSWHAWLFRDLYPHITGNVTVERTASGIRVLLYVAFLLPIVALNLLFDYARIRMVVEDRRSTLGAIAAAASFMRRNAGAVAAVFTFNVLTTGSVFALYWLIAPGAGSDGLSMWAALAVGQLYVVARLLAKLSVWASETALFEQRLAHARFLGRPLPAWPETPLTEAIRISAQTSANL